MIITRAFINICTVHQGIGVNFSHRNTYRKLITVTQGTMRELTRLNEVKVVHLRLF